MSGIGEFVYPEISVNTRNYIRHNFKPTTIELTYKVGLGGFCRFLCINYEVFVWHLVTGFILFFTPCLNSLHLVEFFRELVCETRWLFVRYVIFFWLKIFGFWHILLKCTCFMERQPDFASNQTRWNIIKLPIYCFIFPTDELHYNWLQLTIYTILLIKLFDMIYWSNTKNM